MSRDFPCVHWENDVCKFYSSDDVKEFCQMGPCKEQTFSNGDYIRNMTDEELADFLEGVYGNMEIGQALGWLKQPMEEP